MKIKTTLLTVLSMIGVSLTTATAQEKKAEADNTSINERDRTGATQDPLDQSETAEDLKVTQAIRKAVIADPSLTITAKNVKIITAGGKVTLRGPVNDAEEKTKIEKFARTAAGETNVVNQLEIKAVETK